MWGWEVGLSEHSPVAGPGRLGWPGAQPNGMRMQGWEAELSMGQGDMGLGGGVFAEHSPMV